MSFPYGLGWRPDLPDNRDLVETSDPIKPLLKAVGVPTGAKPKVPKKVDLREWCSPIESQGDLGSCTANAGVGLLEYFERRAFGKHVDGSRLFLYKATRNLMGEVGDTGAYLRDTMKAMALFGVPPENYWPYFVEEFEVEPTAFCYALAQNYQALKYYRLDPNGLSPEGVLARIKANLAGNLPSMFGFTVYTSIAQVDAEGKIPYPVLGEKMEGGHAIAAVGYDDEMEITNQNDDSKTTGAFRIRNSWGTGWGNAGYGWLPYEYVLKGDALDWWALISNEWIDTGAFAK